MKPNRLNSLLSATTAVMAVAFPLAITAYADTALPAGQNNIDTTGNPALGVITRGVGATAWFDNNGTATAAGTPLVNGILGPWASIGTGTATRYATLDGSNNVVGFTTATAAAAFGWPSANNATFNYDVAGVQTALGVSRTGNTARYTGGAGTQTWGNSTGNVTITLNGLLNAGTGTLTFAKGGTGTGTGVVIGANQELVLNAANAGIAISAPIFNNGAGASALTVVGSGGVTLSGANTYTGATTIGSGSLTVSGGNLGSGAIKVVSGATLNINATQTLSQTVSGGGAINSNASTTLTGDFSGFTGTYTHNSTTTSSVFNAANSASANASYVLASAQGSSQGFITAANGDYTLQLGSLSGVANSMFRGGNVATGTATLEVGNLGTNTEFAGIIANGATKIIALGKVGAGTLTLSGASTFTGATTVSAGSLLVNGSLGNSAVSVTGGTLGGSGAIAGAVAVSATLSPGNSIESLSTGSLTMASGSSYVFEVANNSSTGADLVAVNGTLSLTDVSLDFDAASIAAFASGSWMGGNKITLISYSGTGITSGFDGYADDASYFFGSNEWTFNYNDTMPGINFSSDATANGQDRFVTMTLVPEPGAALLGGLGILALLRRRR